MEEKDKRFMHLERKVGMFALVALAGIIVIIVFIGIQQDLFTPKSNIYFIAESGSGLNVGQAVKFKGFKIGKIHNIKLNDTAQVEVTLVINKNYMKWIKSDSKASLVQEGVIGDMIIEILGGTAGAKALEENAKIEFRTATGLGDVVAELKGEVTQLLKEVDKLLVYFNDPKGDLKLTINNLNHLTDELLGTRKNLDNLITDLDKGFAKSVDGLIGDIRGRVVPEIEGVISKADSAVGGINSAAKDLQGTMSEVNTNVPLMLKSIKTSLNNIEGITADVKKGSSEVPALLQGGGMAVEDAQEVVGSLKDMWPISSGIVLPEAKTLKADGYEKK